jgi:hypothetical protein
MAKAGRGGRAGDVGPKRKVEQVKIIVREKKHSALFMLLFGSFPFKNSWNVASRAIFAMDAVLGIRAR